MPRRKRKRTDAAPAPATPHVEVDALTLRKLSECGTRVGLTQCMEHLADAGLLAKHVEAKSVTAKKIGAAVADHATASTPYGPVLQTMELPIPRLRRWAYIHPLALLYHLARISSAFGEMMQSVNVTGRPLRIIVYIDEICPGNPLRPEKARTLQAIYWAIADWPQWVLQRTAAWPCFGTIRSSLVKELPGGVANLMKRILHVFWPADGRDSFHSGVTIDVRDESLIVTGIFAGFIADEKAHKEISSTKGASGNKPCLNCSNVFAKWLATTLALGAVTICCVDPTLFTTASNQYVFDAYDFLASKSPVEREALEIQLGIKYEPHGLLGCPHLRTFLRPVDHMIRDWQHTIVGGGVANVELARALAAMKRHGIQPTLVQDWLEQFTLPKKYGKVDRGWLSKNRLGKNLVSLPV